MESTLINGIETFDTEALIIGGGATGTGAMRDLALRGINCLLIDRVDLNAGASSGTHGLLHSGGRYASADSKTAAECREEGEILKRLAPQCIDDCGGLFVAVEGDDAKFAGRFPEYCAVAGIDCETLTPAEARELEPALSDRTFAAYAVADATVDPNHPYARISNREIRNAFSLFVRSISGMGVGYTQPGETNLNALTPAGTIKPTLSIPSSMAPGIDARDANAKTLIIDFLGLKGFSAGEVVANLKPGWPNLSAARIEFPQMEGGGQLYPEVMARALEVPAHRAQLAERIKAVTGDADYIGLPAILGVHHPDRVHAELERLIGIRLFEIPTMPPGVAGIRLREMFEQIFPDRGLILVPQQNVETLTLNTDGGMWKDFRQTLHCGPLPVVTERVEAARALLPDNIFVTNNERHQGCWTVQLYAHPPKDDKDYKDLLMVVKTRTLSLALCSAVVRLRLYTSN